MFHCTYREIRTAIVNRVLVRNISDNVKSWDYTIIILPRVISMHLVKKTK